MAGWVSRKAVAALVAKGIGKGLRLLTRAGKGNGRDKTNRLTDGTSVGRETAVDARAEKPEIEAS